MLYADVQPGKIRPGDSETVAWSTLRHFSKEEIESFRPDWTNKNAFDRTELLLQSLYGQWASIRLGTPVLDQQLFTAWKIPVMRWADPKNSFGGFIRCPKPNAAEWREKVRKELNQTASPYTDLFHRVLPLAWIFTSRTNDEIKQEMNKRFNIVHPERLATDIYQQPAVPVPDTASVAYLDNIAQFRQWLLGSPSLTVQALEALQGKLQSTASAFIPKHLRASSAAEAAAALSSES